MDSINSEETQSQAPAETVPTDLERQVAHLERRIARLRRAVRRLGWRGFCNNPECRCWEPTDPCELWMGEGTIRGRCACCGWTRKHHEESPNRQPEVQPHGPDEPCTCGNGIGCVLVPLDRW